MLKLAIAIPILGPPHIYPPPHLYRHTDDPMCEGQLIYTLVVLRFGIILKSVDDTESKEEVMSDR